MEKKYSVENVREKHKDAYMPGTPELGNELTIMYCEGKQVKEMAKHFGRIQMAIDKRIKKPELVDICG